MDVVMGHDYPNKQVVYRSGQKRGVTATIKKELKKAQLGRTDY